MTDAVGVTSGAVGTVLADYLQSRAPGPDPSRPGPMESEQKQEKRHTEQYGPDKKAAGEQRVMVVNHLEKLVPEIQKTNPSGWKEYPGSLAASAALETSATSDIPPPVRQNFHFLHEKIQKSSKKIEKFKILVSKPYVKIQNRVLKTIYQILKSGSPNPETKILILESQH